MSQQLSLERMVADWMADEAAGGTPRPGRRPDRRDDEPDGGRCRAGWPSCGSLRCGPRPHSPSACRPGSSSSSAALLLLAAAVAIGAAAALLLRPQPVADAWPGFRGDAARDGLAVNGPIGNPIVRWQFQAGAGSAATSRSPATSSSPRATTGSSTRSRSTTGRSAGRSRARRADARPVRDRRPGLRRRRRRDHPRARADRRQSIWDADRPARRPERPDRRRRPPVRRHGRRRRSSRIDTSTGAEAWRRPFARLAGVHAPAASARRRRHGNRRPTISPRLIRRPARSAGVSRRAMPTRDAGHRGRDRLHRRRRPEPRRASSSRTTSRPARSGWRVDEFIASPVVVGGIGYTAAPTASSPPSTSRRAPCAGGPRSTATSGRRPSPATSSTSASTASAGSSPSTGRRAASCGASTSTAPTIAASPSPVASSSSGPPPGRVYAIGGDGATLTPKPARNDRARSRPRRQRRSGRRPTRRRLDTSVLWAVDSGAPDFMPWGACAGARRAALGHGRIQRPVLDLHARRRRSSSRGGRRASGDGEFDLTRANGDPYGMVAFAPDGSFYVLDAGNRRIQQFDADRTFLRAWGSFGTGPGQFNDPVGLAVDADGNVHVLDDVRGVIETFDADGQRPADRSRPSRPARPGAARTACRSDRTATST